VQDGHPTSGGQTVGGQICKSVDLAELRPVTDGFCHWLSFLALGHVLVNINGRVSEPVVLFHSIAMHKSECQQRLTRGFSSIHCRNSGCLFGKGRGAIPWGCRGR
jgi:hypothetical protein